MTQKDKDRAELPKKVALAAQEVARRYDTWQDASTEESGARSRSTMALNALNEAQKKYAELDAQMREEFSGGDWSVVRRNSFAQRVPVRTANRDSES